ncbi:hypothetical protein ACJJWD_07475 [Comamonas testosteroni]|uniref:hypothetical protein n=1 Tax=Comamonas testosteroni TaxID=285 RepID=UPI00389A817B
MNAVKHKQLLNKEHGKRGLLRLGSACAMASPAPGKLAIDRAKRCEIGAAPALQNLYRRLCRKNRHGLRLGHEELAQTPA